MPETAAAIARCTSDGTILDVNPAMAALLGESESSRESASFARLAPRHWPALAASVSALGRLESAELPLTRADGSTAWLIMSLAVVDVGGRPVIDVVGLDITEKKEREDSYLRQAEIESAISAIYSDLLLSDGGQLPVAIERGLHRIGLYTGALRAHFFTFVDPRRFRSDFEWCADGLPRRFRKGDIIPAKVLARVLCQFRKTRSVAASVWAEIHPRVRRLLESESITSTVVAPLRGEADVLGVLILEFSGQGVWTEETLLIMQLAAETFARALERERMQDALRSANRRLEDGVNRRTAELRALTARLLRIQEEERTALARDIHDELGQYLTELHLGIAALKGVEQRAEQQRSIDELGELVRRTIKSVQRVAADLRPALLDRVGIVAAIDANLESLRMRTGIRVSKQIEPDIDLDPPRATAVYRIVQEAMTNVIRHSGATRVEIRLRRWHDRVVLKVRDNGNGIAEEQTAGIQSLGLLGMRERARMCGGTLQIRGRAGKGTVVRVTLPLIERERNR